MRERAKNQRLLDICDWVRGAEPRGIGHHHLEDLIMRYFHVDPRTARKYIKQLEAEQRIHMLAGWVHIA